VPVDGHAAQTCLGGNVAHAGVRVAGKTSLGGFQYSRNVSAGIGTQLRGSIG
jgi:hypothetical protein